MWVTYPRVVVSGVNVQHEYEQMLVGSDTSGRQDPNAVTADDIRTFRDYRIMTTAEDRPYYKKVSIRKYLNKRAIEDNGWYNNNLDTTEAYTIFRGYG